MLNGKVYEQQTPEQLTTGTASLSSPQDLLPTPTLGHIRNYDEDVEDYLERKQKGIDGEYRGIPGISLGVAINLLRTPSAIEADGGAISEKEARDKNRMVQLRDQIAELAYDNGYEVSPKIAEYLNQTPLAKDLAKTNAWAIKMGVTPRPLEWGKFKAAIERWEQTTGTKAPRPTLPDGKDGNHRLSAAFVEWLMGLKPGHITDVNLTRKQMLKACGNGVVPQQAALALRILDPIEEVTL